MKTPNTFHIFISKPYTRHILILLRTLLELNLSLLYLKYQKSLQFYKPEFEKRSLKGNNLSTKGKNLTEKSVYMGYGLRKGVF